MNGFISVLLLNYRVDTQPTKLTNFLIQIKRAFQNFPYNNYIHCYCPLILQGTGTFDVLSCIMVAVSVIPLFCVAKMKEVNPFPEVSLAKSPFRTGLAR